MSDESNKRIADNVFVDDDNLLKLDLPKWPAFVVSGNPVTEKQAAEILIRTDSFLPDFTYAGNDKHHAKRLNRLFGIPDDKSDMDNIRSYWAALDDLKCRLNKLTLDYISNDRIVSAWIGGPHGWCSWTGDIFCNTFNIGKWPDIKDVAEEWGIVAKAFPFLDLRCQLFSGETSEHSSVPIVEYVVSEGIVVVVAPRGQIAPPVSAPFSPGIFFGSTIREQGITAEELRDKLHLAYGEEIPQFRCPVEDTENGNSSS